MSRGSRTRLVNRWEEREEVRPATRRKERKCGVCVDEGGLGVDNEGGVER
jgi:hypothetical protein